MAVTRRASENLVVAEGTWSVAAGDYSSVTIEDGATVTSTVTLNNDDLLTIETGGKLVNAAINWTGGGDAVVENSGVIGHRPACSTPRAAPPVRWTFNNDADGLVHGAITPARRCRPCRCDDHAQQLRA